ncbi:LOW QUALITY PROTEIN: death-inducer obliterator 1-like [Erethizon dorsatum]
MDDAGDQRSTDAPEAINPTRKEFRKTWGIRTTMITQREGAGDTEVDPAKQWPHSPSLRHRKRWLKHTEQVGELLSTVWQHGGEDVAVSLEDPREPVSCAVTLGQSALEGSVESSSEMKSAPAPGSKSVKERPASSKKAGGWGELGDTSDSDSDGFTLEGLQNCLPRKPEQEPAERWLKGIRSRLREQCREEDPSNTVEVEAGSAGHSVPPCKQDTDTEAAQRAVNQAGKDDRERESEAATVHGPKDKDPRDLGRHRHEGYDSSALYCICRQPHGNRLICCDRCEEWFHGDCVGISEARGQLPERNRDGHLCPDCTTLRAQDKRTSEATDDQEPGRRPGGADDTERKSRGTGEQKSGADPGSEGRTEEPSSHSSEKTARMSLPTPLWAMAVTSAALSTAGENCLLFPAASLFQLSQSLARLSWAPDLTPVQLGLRGPGGSAGEAAFLGALALQCVCPCDLVTVAPGAVPCAGPGCSSVAQPDTVYCSSDCILKHAAAAMRLLSAQKGHKPKPKKKVKVKPEELCLPKPSMQAGIKTSFVHKRPAPDEIENPAKKAMVTPPRGDALGKEVAGESSTASWASDHKSSAVMAEKTAAPSPPCWAPKDPRRVDRAERAASGSEKTAPPGSSAGRQPSSRSLLPKKPHPFVNTAGAKPPSRFRGPIPKRPRLWEAPAGTSAARQEGPMPVPLVRDSKMSPCSAALMGARRRPAVTSVSIAAAAPGCLRTVGPALSQPESHMRQNIRRSLKEALWKRVCESDDLIMTENEVGTTALHLEKEMFNLFQVTDNRCRSKYRSIVFHLKDPENQGLFHRVMREEISLEELVRMTPEELVSKELSMWKDRPTKSEQQKSVCTVCVKSTAPLPDAPSTRFKDLTSQHRAHLFDLNCKICTGQVPSEDEPTPKKQKLSPSAKKEDLKPKPGSSPPDLVPHLSSEGSAEALPKGASEPHPERASGPEPERKYVPGHPGDRCARPSPLEGLSSCPVGMVTTVTVSNRDPRTAVSRTCPITASAGSHWDSIHTVEARPDLLKPALPSVMLPKSILAKPSSSLDLRRLSVPPSPSVSISESQSPRIGDRTLSLPHLTSIWKGLINMQSVGKFVTKAYPASGSCVCLSEDLPDTMHVGGRIAPKTVWDYVGKLQSSVSKELCLIRFQPATREEEGAYTSLSSYFSGCGRFGVVTNTHGRVRDLYLIPLRAEDAVPPALLPFAGPGLESPRPNLLLGLVISEKQKHLPEPGELDGIPEKQVPPDTPGCHSLPAAPQSNRKPPESQPSSAAVDTPPPSPPPLPPLPEAPVLKTLSSLAPGATRSVTTPATAAPAPTAASPVPRRTADPASPLRFIFQTLFKGSFFPAACNDTAGRTPTPQQDCNARGQEGPLGVLLLDPIVQQFGHFTNDGTQEEEEDDGPYDPEEGYNMEWASDTLLAKRGKWPGMKKAPDASERAGVAYDPEDETFLEAARVTIVDLPNVMCADLGSSPQERPGDHTEHRPPPARQGRQETGGELKSSLAKGQLFPQELRALDQSPGALGANHTSFLRHSRDPRQARHLKRCAHHTTLYPLPLQEDAILDSGGRGVELLLAWSCSTSRRLLCGLSTRAPRPAVCPLLTRLSSIH